MGIEEYANLYSEHYRWSVRVAWGILGEESLAEDAAQEAWIRVWLYSDKWSRKISFRGWLRRIAVNCAFDQCKLFRSKRISQFGYEKQAARAMWNNRAFYAIPRRSAPRLSEMKKSINSLSPMGRALIHAFLSGYTLEDISVESGIAKEQIAVDWRRTLGVLAASVYDVDQAVSSIGNTMNAGCS